MTITQSPELKWKTKVFGEKKEMTQISKTEEDLWIQKKKKRLEKVFKQNWDSLLHRK